jgi:hypothetical protein
LRRVLEILAVLLFFAGLELAARTLSHTVSHLDETFRTAFAGESFVFPPPAFLVGSALVAIGATLWLLTIWANSQAKLVQPGPNCPRCGAKTNRLKRSRRNKLLAALLGHRVTRRRCGQCSWGGLSLKQ